MSYDLRTKTSAPSTPASGKVITYTDTNGRVHLLDATGVDNVLNSTQKYNYARNSGFWFAQRQTPSSATTYTNLSGRSITADGWGVTNEVASVTYRRIDTSGAYDSGLQNRYWGEYVKIGTIGKFIVTQVIEGVTCQNLRGRTVRLTVWFKGVVGTPVMNMGLIAHTGTVNSIAATFISAFGANGVDPTLGTNLAYIAPKSGVTGENNVSATNAYRCTVSGAWVRYSGVFDVPTNANNLIVAFWSHNQVSTTNGIGIAQVCLTDGYETQDWAPQSNQEELDRVLRFYQKTFAIDTAPVQNAGNPGALQAIVGKAGAVALAAQGQWRYEVRMRAAATTLTTYSPGAATAQARRINGAAAADLSATATANSSETSVDWTATGDASGAVGDAVKVHMSADAEL